MNLTDFRTATPDDADWFPPDWDVERMLQEGSAALLARPRPPAPMPWTTVPTPAVMSDASAPTAQLLKDRDYVAGVPDIAEDPRIPLPGDRLTPRELAVWREQQRLYHLMAEAGVRLPRGVTAGVERP